MQIKQVDDRGRLFQVQDLLPAEQSAELLSLDWANFSWARGPGQETWLRRAIKWEHPEVKRMSSYISDQLPKINQLLGTDFATCNGHFWLDEPGFQVDLHTDGELPNAMQIYWIVPNETYGTGFYFYKNTQHLLYQFESRPNSGYLMLNHPDELGAQPLYWHGMFNPVPEGTLRLSSYWYFQK